MFGRARPPESKVLSGRIRQIAERPAAAARPPSAPKGRADRAAQFKAATLILDGGDRLKAAITDLSETGARLQSHMHGALPDEFVLSEPLLKVRRRVRVVWQKSGSAGVRFID